MLPKPILKVVKKRGHLRNLEKLLAKEYPSVLKKLLKRYPSFKEGVFLETGGKKGQCLVCKSPTRFVNFVAGYKSYCGNECRAKSPLVTSNRKATCLIRFGASSPMGSKRVRELFKKTMRERYGVEWAMQSKEIQLKSISSCLERFGVEYNVQRPEFKEYVSSIMDQVQKNRERTFKKRLGVRSPLQDPDIFERQQKSAMTVRSETIGGRTFEFRGYEGQVIKYLVNEKGLKPSRIINRVSRGLPTVRYKDLNGVERLYYPDMFIDGTSTIIEVKSIRTVGIHDPDVFEKNVCKFKGVQRAGYDLWLVVTNGKGDKRAWIKNPRSISTVKAKIRRSGILF